MDIVGPDRPGLLDQAAEHPLVAGQRRAVSGRRSGALARERPTFSTTTGTPASRARRQPLAQPRSAVVLEVQRDRADAVLAGEELEVVGGAEHDRLVAARDHRVKAQPAARRERVDGHVAALGDERHRPGLGRGERVAPQRDAVARRRRSRCSWARTPAARNAPRRRRSSRLQLHALGHLAEAGADHDRATAAPGAGLLDHLGHAGGRDRDHERVDRDRQLGDRSARTGCPRTSSRLGLTPHTSPSKPIVLEVLIACAA